METFTLREDQVKQKYTQKPRCLHQAEVVLLPIIAEFGRTWLPFRTTPKQSISLQADLTSHRLNDLGISAVPSNGSRRREIYDRQT